MNDRFQPARPSTRPIVDCAQCGKPIPAPDWSETADARSIRYLWVCQACDYAFETLVRFPSQRAA